MCLDDASALAASPTTEAICPPGQCKDFWSDTDQEGVTRRLCGWCGKVKD